MVSWFLPALLLEKTQVWDSSCSDYKQPAAPHELQGQTAGKSSKFTRPSRSGTNQHENMLHPSNCTASLHCQLHYQQQSISTTDGASATDGAKTEVRIGPVLQFPTRKEGARTTGGRPVSSLATRNCPHAARGSMATSGLQWSCPGSPVPSGEGDPRHLHSADLPQTRVYFINC